VIVDSHVHVIGPDRNRYPLTPRELSGKWYFEAPCSAERFLEEMDGAGVDQAVLVQAVGAYTFDNAYAADSAAARPDRFASAACIDPQGADPRGDLDRWLVERGMRGVRIFAVSRTSSWLGDPKTFPIWEHALARGAHLIVTIMGPHQLPELVRFLEAFRDTEVSLDHCGFPDAAKPESLLALARFPKLQLKVTTHVIDVGAEHAGEPQPFVARIAREFGADRMMWGSDFSQTWDRPYAALAALGRRAAEGLSAADRAAYLGGTAARLWKL